MLRRTVAAAVALAGLGVAAACGYSNPYSQSGPVAGLATVPPTASPTPPPNPDHFSDGAGLTPRTLAGGLQVIDLKVGTGAGVVSGQTVAAQYTGWLSNGTQFDTSRTRGQPFTFIIGKHQVIKGWEEGVVGMKVGGKRKLIIPSALGYGPSGYPPTIPGNAVLVFDIELVSAGPVPTPSPTPTPKK